MTTLALALIAGLLGASADTTPGGTAIDSQTKFDWGRVASIDPKAQHLIVSTASGPLVLDLGPQVRWFGPPGSGELRPGERVRVYYRVEGGARATEIDRQ